MDTAPAAAVGGGPLRYAFRCQTAGPNHIVLAARHSCGNSSVLRESIRSRCRTSPGAAPLPPGTASGAGRPVELGKVHEAPGIVLSL